jgi:hypothetical protein
MRIRFANRIQVTNATRYPENVDSLAVNQWAVCHFVLPKSAYWSNKIMNVVKK